MSHGITSLVWSVALSLVFVFTGCAKDRVAFDGAAGQRPVAQQLVASGNGVIQNKLCPVMGEPLSSMGDPVPVTVDGETLFVCCRGCVKKVKADPAKYFAIARNQ